MLNKIQYRLEESKKEIQQSTLYDYILTNIDVEETANNLRVHYNRRTVSQGTISTFFARH